MPVRDDDADGDVDGFVPEAVFYGTDCLRNEIKNLSHGLFRLFHRTEQKTIY